MRRKEMFVLTSVAGGFRKGTTSSTGDGAAMMTVACGCVEEVAAEVAAVEAASIADSRGEIGSESEGSGDMLVVSLHVEALSNVDVSLSTVAGWVMDACRRVSIL